MEEEEREEEEGEDEEEERLTSSTESASAEEIAVESVGGDVERPRPKSWACCEDSSRDRGSDADERRRRRQTAAPLLLSEALSSLLWVPYDLQQSDPCRPRHNMDTGDPPPAASRSDSDQVQSGVPQVQNVSVVRVNETGCEDRTFPSGNQVSATEDPRRPRRHRHPRLPDLLDLPPPYSPPPPLGLPTTFHHIIPSRRRAGGSVYREVPKGCCGLLSPAVAVSLRWFMILLLTVGVCCALVGTVLGATRATAPHHLTIALLMIGIGIVLVTLSGVAWRVMSADSPSCRAMLGLGPTSDADPNRRFLPRLPPSYGRPHHPYAAMMYPEFQYRAPPPSYQASMQEYRLRLLLLDRTPASPPPTYRSHPNNLLRGGLGRLGMDYSRPPSYRSRTSSSRQDATVHSRQTSSVKDTIEEKDGCNVTIVGTEEPPPGPVIVTISGRDLPTPPQHSSGDHIQILAHL